MRVVAAQLSRGGDWFTDKKKFMPDPEPKLPSKSDPEPKKIIPDPQHADPNSGPGNQLVQISADSGQERYNQQ